MNNNFERTGRPTTPWPVSLQRPKPWLARSIQNKAGPTPGSSCHLTAEQLRRQCLGTKLCGVNRGSLCHITRFAALMLSLLRWFPHVKATDPSKIHSCSLPASSRIVLTTILKPEWLQGKTPRTSTPMPLRRTATHNSSKKHPRLTRCTHQAQFSRALSPSTVISLKVNVI